jgi:CheY-like chemotaxis protein
MPAAQKPRKILAADDSPVGRRILEEFLRHGDHRARCVADGAAAMTAFEAEEFELVLLDIRMPGTDGPTAARWMRECERRRGRRRTPIVALTADPIPPPDADGLRGDFDDYVMKPFTAETLQRTIDRAIQGDVDRGGGVATLRELSSPAEGDRAQVRRAAVLARLQGRVGLLNELVELFSKEAPALFAELEQAATAGNFVELLTSAHRLRGQLEMLEDEQAAPIARRLEQACADEDRAAAVGEFAALAEVWPEACREITQLSNASSIANYA